MTRKRKKIEIKHGIKSCKTIDDYINYKIAKGWIDEEGFYVFFTKEVSKAEVSKDKWTNYKTVYEK